jgi:hypothetical protein
MIVELTILAVVAAGILFAAYALAIFATAFNSNSDG